MPWGKASPWTVVGQLMNGGRLALPPLAGAADAAALPGAAADNAAFAPQLPALAALIQRCWAQEQAARPEFDEVIRTLRSVQ